MIFSWIDGKIRTRRTRLIASQISENLGDYNYVAIDSNAFIDSSHIQEVLVKLQSVDNPIIASIYNGLVYFM